MMAPFEAENDCRPTEIAEVAADPDIVPVRRMRALDFDHECGCPGSFEAQMQAARAEGWENAHDDFCVVAGQMLCTLHVNPYQSIPTASEVRDA